MAHKTRTQIATGVALLSTIFVAAVLLTSPPKSYVPKMRLGAMAPLEVVKTVYTPKQFAVLLPISASSPIFVQAQAVQSKENNLGKEVGKGALSAGSIEQDSPAQEAAEIQGGKEQNV